MTDVLLTSKQRMEALSVAYVRTVSASSGYDVAKTDFDMDSIDLTIRAGGGMRPSIDIQLKATTILDIDKKDHWPFQISRKNFDDLRETVQTPRYLVLFRMPRAEHDWMFGDENALSLKHCAYWLSLRGLQAVDTESKVVHVPKANIFNVAALRRMMEASRQGNSV